VTSESRGRKAMCLLPNKLPWKQKVMLTCCTGWLAGKTALMDTDLECPKTFFW